jgi:hypothetical protein
MERVDSTDDCLAELKARSMTALLGMARHSS